MTLEYIRLSRLSVEELTSLWNRGFEGYFVDIKMTVDSFLSRIVNEGVSLEDSFAVYLDGLPAGFVANGFRTISGKKTAWNGGTGIVPEFRGQGIGKKLMEYNLAYYAEQGAQAALLEALGENERAIRLYESVGYHVFERLVFYQQSDLLDGNFPSASTPILRVRKGLPREVRDLPFYRELSAWQNQWAGIRDGESALVSDGNETVGYALFKRVFAPEGDLSAINLYQCEVKPGREDAGDILNAALRAAFAPLDQACKRIAMNLRESNTGLTAILQKLGFQNVLEQVHMIHRLDGK